MSEQPTEDSGTTTQGLGDATVDGGPDPATDEFLQNEADGADIPTDDQPNLSPEEEAMLEARTHYTLVGRVQPANRRAEGAGFATHLHISVESRADGRMIDVFDHQAPIIDREESIPMPVKVHKDADEIAITITSVRENDDMEVLELARHQRIKVKDLRRGPMVMPLFHQSKAITIPPPSTLIIDDFCGLDDESIIGVDETPIAEPNRPIYHVGDAVATPHGVGRISDFKEGDIVVVNIASGKTGKDAQDEGVIDGKVDKEFAADEIQPYSMPGG